MKRGTVSTQSGPLAQLVEQLTFNQWVAGSNPARLTTEIKGLEGFGRDAGPALPRFGGRMGDKVGCLSVSSAAYDTLGVFC